MGHDHKPGTQCQICGHASFKRDDDGITWYGTATIDQQPKRPKSATKCRRPTHRRKGRKPLHATGREVGGGHGGGRGSGGEGGGCDRKEAGPIAGTDDPELDLAAAPKDRLHALHATCAPPAPKPKKPPKSATKTHAAKKADRAPPDKAGGGGDNTTDGGGGGKGGDPTAAAAPAADPELDLAAAPKDLHALRAADPALDARAFAIQRRSVDEAAARLVRDEPLAVGALRGARVLVTGASGYLGAALAALARALGGDVAGLDSVPPNAATATLLEGVPVAIGSAGDPAAVRAALFGASSGAGVDVEACAQESVASTAASDGAGPIGPIVFHAAALHAPHAARHTEAEFREANCASVDAVLAAGARAVVATSTTSHTVTARVKRREADGACVWLDETAGGAGDAAPRNKYGRTKREGERRLLAAASGPSPRPNVVVLRASRFFCEDLLEGSTLPLPNAMANELLGRRAALADLLAAHVRAALRAPALHGRVLTLSAPWPARLSASGWTVDRLRAGARAADVAAGVAEVFGRDAFAAAGPGWALPAAVSRVYDASAAMEALDWRPEYTFGKVLERIRRGDPVALQGLY